MRRPNLGICRTIRLILNKQNASCRIARSVISLVGFTRRSDTCALHRVLRNLECKAEHDVNPAHKSTLIRDVLRRGQLALSGYQADSVLLVLSVSVIAVRYYQRPVAM